MQGPKVEGVGRDQSAADTREALLGAAVAAFAKQGYHRVSLDALVASLDLTKGALYHHFASKRELFAACYERQAARITAFVAAAPYADDSLELAIGRFHTFLDFGLRTSEPVIPLQQAMSVLGINRWREIEMRHTMALLKGTLVDLMAAGLIPKRDLGMLSSIVHGLLAEAALVVSRSDNPAETRREAEQTVFDMLSGLSAAASRD